MLLHEKPKSITPDQIFQQIVMKEKLVTIRSLFKIGKGGAQINYKPPYQRNYIWKGQKATNLIESIIKHADLPPMIHLITPQIPEVIDGRQRSETIDRFINDRFTLQPAGLDQLWHLGNKRFSQLTPDQAERILETKLRVITVEFKQEGEVPQEMIDLVTKEIFKRYNLGMTPLKKEEIFKAQYLRNALNNYLKHQIDQSEQFKYQLYDLFIHRTRSSETMLHHIRKLLVFHNIPISRYINERDDAVNKFFDYNSQRLSNDKAIISIFNNFQEKIFSLVAIKEIFKEDKITTTGLVYDCIIWALSVCEIECPGEVIKTNSRPFQQKLVRHISKQMNLFDYSKSHHRTNIQKRYRYIGQFFQDTLKIPFDKYLFGSDTFLATQKELIQRHAEERFQPELEAEQYSKMHPTSSTIEDLLAEIFQKKFIIRPPYQRGEVMDIVKASGLIESILCGLRLNPLYVFKRKDGIKELIDGQQRLLSIIGYVGAVFRNEYGTMERSRKNCFRLNLPDTQWHKLKYADLQEHFKNKIMAFDIGIVEISEEHNPYFRPEDLFKRLNHKPHPIKPNSFEFWNAYAKRSIIDSIKTLQREFQWFRLLKNDTRMNNEAFLTTLVYLQHIHGNGNADYAKISGELIVYPRKNHVTVQFKDKGRITTLLENPSKNRSFQASIEDTRNGFLAKLLLIIKFDGGFEMGASWATRMDILARAKVIRTASNCYILWILLLGIPFEAIRRDQNAALNKLLYYIYQIGCCESSEEFECLINECWEIG